MQTVMREQILTWIEEDREALVQFLSRFVAVPSPNLPGDTRAAAGFLLEHLRTHGVAAEIRAAKLHLPNIVASFGGAESHLVLNGHIDVFPAGPPRPGRAIRGAAQSRAAGCMGAGSRT